MKKLFFLIAMLIIGLTSNVLDAQSGWTLQTNPLGSGESAMIGKVQFVSPTEGWISGALGDLLHTTDAGDNWLVVTPFPNDTLWSFSDPARTMSWVDPMHGWQINAIGQEFGVSSGVVIHRTIDGGNTWIKDVLSTEEDDVGVQIQFVDINNGWLLYVNLSTWVATFLKTTDGGNNWSLFNGAGIFHFVDANNGWAYFGTGPYWENPPFTVLRTNNGGINWTVQFTDNTPGAYNAIYFSDLDHGWIVGNAGKVLQTTDGGTNWHFVTNSGVNPQERCTTVFFLDANTGWISTKDGDGNGILQHTTDGGANWTSQATPLTNPQGSNAIFSVYFIDAQNGWLTADKGKICHFTGSSGIEGNNVTLPDFVLLQNYPNPFNPSTTIKMELAEAGNVELAVYNSKGQKVKTLVDSPALPGTYEYLWNGKDENGSSVASGQYVVKLQQNGKETATKIMLLK
ncbi:MAG: T9SS type A sorting domain-containing protein [Candidatus Cloacimonetes bacterium]|nr:T9SS type A sorting domain-containing protein [Candidatus Cloacimonadota bacterium]